ncbi:MAG TPA: hypothetical protein VFE94_00065 [Candidatus Paceibacterota bacterium]|nr:hypothetical protein [Candidatus Paceibacterota bacterium]
MKKVIICGSISAADDILAAKKTLEEKGYEVEIPEGVKHLADWEGSQASLEEKAERKIKYDLIRGYYEKMKGYDMVLVVNPEKKGVPGYIGGNTFLEMGFAHILNKPLYVLHEIPELSYASEILGMQPVMLNGDLEKLR